MGGFSKVVAEGISDAVDNLFEKAASSNNIGMKFIAENVASMDRTFKGHPIGESVRTMINKGVNARNQAQGWMRTPLNQFEGVVKKDPQLAQMHDYKTASISQIYNSLPQGHAGKVALHPLMQNPANYHLSLDDMRGIADQKANLYARNKVFGPDSAYLASLMQPLYRSGSPLDHSRAEAMMAAVSQVFRDTTEVEDYAGRVSKQSAIKRQVAEAINLPRVRAGQDPIPISTGAEYTPAPSWEKQAHEKVHDFLAPLIFVSHMSDFFKLPMQVPARALWESFRTINDPTINALKDASGIFNHTLHSIYDHDFNYRTGRIAKLTGVPDAGAIINKLYHQPLFNNIRMSQLSIFGTAAYHQAQIWGRKALHGDAYSIEQLKSMQLDPTAIIRRNGILNDDELSQAIFHFTNNRLFIDNPLERAKITQGNPFMRLAFDLHGYATKEGRFIAKELYKMGKHEQYGKIAQFAGVLGIAFPLVAPLLQSMSTLIRDADPEEAKEKLKDTYGHLFHPSGFGDFAGTYFDLLGHFAGVGAFWTYLHAAATHRLAENMLGPGAEIYAGTTQDLISGGKRQFEGKGGHPMQPFMRDYLKYFTIPILGGAAAHWLYPKRRTR